MSRSFDHPCTVRVEVSPTRCRADVELDGDLPINPGDRVRVHGQPIRARLGEARSYRRIATVERAGPLRRAWARLSGHFALTHLYEVSFTGAVR